MKISVVGSGYVGLVTALSLAGLGHETVCVDKVEDVVRKIGAGIPPFFEPGLEEMLGRRLAAGNFSATLDLPAAVRESDVTFVCVGTPMSGDKKIDLRFVEQAIDEIAGALAGKDGYHLVVVKSTVVPGTSERMGRKLWSKTGRNPASVGVCMNPEFLREGSALDDSLHPDRIIIGQSDERAGDMLEGLWRPFAAPVVRTNLRTAEMIKYAANSFFAMLISYSNELARIAEGIGDIDIRDVLAGITLDRRISLRQGERVVTPEMSAYLAAGCGYGGSCFPKDVNALYRLAGEHGYRPELLGAVIDVNDRQLGHTVALLREAGEVAGREITVMGTAFKPHTDDIRESPALSVADGLLEAGASVRLCDPQALAGVRRRFAGDPRVSYFTDAGQALTGAEGAILVTAWPEFRRLTPEDFVSRMARPVLVDGRGVYDRAEFSRRLIYRVVGYREC